MQPMKWYDYLMMGLCFGMGFEISAAVLNFVVGILQQHK